MERDGLIVGSVIIVIAVIFIYGAVTIDANPTVYTATVVDKFYTPPSTSTGTGIGADGKVTTVTTHTYEKFVLQMSTGRFLSVNRETFIRFSVGNRVKVTQGFTYIAMELVK